MCPRIQDSGLAKLAVMATAKVLGVDCDCRLTQTWVIFIDPKDKEAFIELAKGTL